MRVRNQRATHRMQPLSETKIPQGRSLAEYERHDAAGTGLGQSQRHHPDVRELRLDTVVRQTTGSQTGMIDRGSGRWGNNGDGGIMGTVTNGTAVSAVGADGHTGRREKDIFFVLC